MINDIETKLNSEFPWSQKFKEYPVEINQFTIWSTSIDCYWYRYLIDSCNTVELYAYPDVKILAHPNTDIIKYCSGDTVIDMTLDRVGGPATYHVTSGKIKKMKYSLCGVTIDPLEYWKVMYSDIYKGSIEIEPDSHDLLFKCPKELPGPYSYNYKTKRFTWMLNGRKVSASDYWKNMEIEFTTLPCMRKTEAEIEETRELVRQFLKRRRTKKLGA